MSDIGRLLMIAGGILFIVGLVFTFSGRVPWLGNLPGDLRVQRDGFTLYAPLGTMVVLSLLLTLALNVIVRFLR